ncbi:flagellin [Kamptonema cortianum]|nr:flagellin [Geitlerinema splendidum]MDK3160904.1 flagellin [Kamptonema cortianum]
MSFRINTNTPAMTALRNLGATNNNFSQSINRLSTGMRINSAADDPAGLIFSENFRAQIGGVTQAIRNNQDAINYAKTAEGALDEIARLLREGRSLAVASANSAVLSPSQLQANQTQWNLIASSIDRISTETQFGKKKLLDGSSGVNGSVVNMSALQSVALSGTFGNASLGANSAIDVNVTTAATKAALTTTRTVTSANLAAYEAATVGAAAGQFTINGTQFVIPASDTWGEVVSKINKMSAVTGVVAIATHNGTTGSIALRSTTYGTKGNFSLTDSGVMSSAAGVTTATGINAVATVTIGSTAVTFNGGQIGNDGLTLTDNNGNTIKLQEGASGNYAGAAYVTVGSAQFQTGANANQRAVLSIGSFMASVLGVNNLDMTSTAGANAALAAIDDAISSLSLKRGEIGSFMRNVLESNVRALGITKENLSATESMVRDVDVAEEMTQYTKFQILQQSGISVLAQANSSPQAVLNLLRG